MLVFEGNSAARALCFTADGAALIAVGHNGAIDAWTLAAIVEISALERVDGSSISIVAEGDAVWRDRDGQEQRGSRLVFLADTAPAPATPERATGGD